MTSRPLLIGLPLLALALPLASRGNADAPAPQQFHLEYYPARRVRISHEVTRRFTDAAFRPSAYYFGTPQLPSIPGVQDARIAKVEVRGLGEQKLAEGKEKLQGRPYLFQEVPAEGVPALEKGISYTLTYEALTYGMRLVNGPQPPGLPLAAMPGDEQAKCLQTTPSCDWKSPAFVALADRMGWRLAPEEDHLAFLYRFEESLLKNGYAYGENVGGDAGQNLLEVVKRKSGIDCGGYATLTAAVCRLNGIPFDMLPGRKLKSGNLALTCHAVGIACLPKYGNFVLDTSRIVKFRDLRYFYVHEGGLLAFERGTDLCLKDVFGAEHSQLVFQAPYVAARGTGGSPKWSVEDYWAVTDLPLQ